MSEVMPQEDKPIPERWREIHKNDASALVRQLIEELGAAEAQRDEAHKKSCMLSAREDQIEAETIQPLRAQQAALSATEKRLREALDNSQKAYLTDAQETLALIRAALAHPREEGGK